MNSINVYSLLFKVYYLSIHRHTQIVCRLLLLYPITICDVLFYCLIFILHALAKFRNLKVLSLFNSENPNPNITSSSSSSTYIYIYIYINVVIVIFIWWSPFIPSRNLDEVFTYNHIYMALMSLRSRSHVKASMVLTRADHLFIHNYIRSLLNNILRPIL